MKTIAAFTMALTTLVLATAADADVRDRRCQVSGKSAGISVRAGTACLIPWRGSGYSGEIIKPPHEGTAVLRADGIYYSPTPGFTGRDLIGVRTTDRSACQPPEKLRADHSKLLSPNPQCPVYHTGYFLIFVE
jgi:hypothetical protein